MSFIIEAYDPNKTYSNQKKFNCGNETIDRFIRSSLKKQVRENLSRAYVVLDIASDERMVGFYTLASHSIEASLIVSLSAGSLPGSIPCVRLIMLGVDASHKRRGLGKQLLIHAMDKLIAVSECTGTYGLYLDADPAAVDFYKKHSFLLLTDRKDPSPTPMFLLLSTIQKARVL